jgi:molecular chaperone DnaK
LLTGIPPAPRGVPQIQVSFDIDVDGILKVSARDKGTGKEQSILITNTGALSSAEIERMREESERYATEDRRRMELLEIKKQLDNLFYGYELVLEKEISLIDNQLQEEIEEKKQQLEAAIEDSSVTIAQIKSMMEDLRQNILQVGAKAYNKTTEELTQGLTQGAYSHLEEQIPLEALKEEDDEFRTIEEEILSGLSQISKDSADFEFDYDQDETITGDYEAVD